ncbi:hypothetical protein NT05LI_3265, partial [Listeria ivanovii FSL F6-596]
AAAAGQPASMIVKFRPKRSTICCAAGPKLLDSKLITRLIPTNPIPIVIAERSAFFAGTRKINAIKKIIIGKITVGPKFKTYCTPARSVSI